MPSDASGISLCIPRCTLQCPERDRQTSCHLGIGDESPTIEQLSQEWVRLEGASDIFGSSFFMIPISLPNADGDDDTTGNADIAELLRKFSISRSNVDARFLTEFARFRISCKSASAESRTSLHPFESSENALVEDSIIDRDGEEEEEENVIPVVVGDGGD